MITILSSFKISFSSFPNSRINSKIVYFKPAIIKLKESGVDSAFIYYLLADSRTQFDEKYVKINVTGFLKKTDYSHHYNDYSVQKSIDFMNKHKANLKNCEIKYGVPPEIVTSVLWIETKHGNFLGNHHIASVFLSTVMTNEDDFIEMNKNVLYQTFDGDSIELKKLESKIIKRAKKKSKWAINEIASLEKIYKSKTIDILALNGSWAGAFGLSQFLPSSYFNWAVDGNADKVIDLFDIEDAIFSVGNYLKTNGWKSSDESHSKAIYHYNHSKDYVNAVLTLAKKIKEKTQNAETIRKSSN